MSEPHGLYIGGFSCLSAGMMRWKPLALYSQVFTSLESSQGARVSRQTHMLNSHAGGGQSRARKVLIKFHSPLLWEGPIWGFLEKPLQPSEEEELSTEDEY